MTLRFIGLNEIADLTSRWSVGAQFATDMLDDLDVAALVNLCLNRSRHGPLFPYPLPNDPAVLFTDTMPKLQLSHLTATPISLRALDSE